MIHLSKVTHRNLWELLELCVSDEQKSFVAPNTVSIAEAYLTLSVGGKVFPFGIYEEDTPVGFLMIGYGVDETFENPPCVAAGNYSLWRLMIDARYQGRGFGRQALRLALDFIRTFPCGPAQYCYLSYEPENERAKALYHSFGFYETGEMDGDEQIAVLKLDSQTQSSKTS